ncbi:MAG TPA: glycosyltransferase 87 family protein [Candidatus Sulfotelmatobacter sp.]|nr:glycosyltransferase 87 family protein [Candidatus Sulfotelmatobacter sp.]
MIAALALCLALVGAAAMLDYHLHLFIPRVLQVRAAKSLGNGYSFGDDFYPIWLTARQWRAEHRDPYSPEMTRVIQTGLFGRPLDAHNPNDPPTDYREFSYPAFTELILWPASALEFPTLRLVLVVLLPLLTAASVWLWMLALQWRINLLWLAMLVVLTLCNYPVLEGIFAEQPGLIVGFLLASSALALKKDRLLLSGTLLALTLIKPQMTVLAAAYLLLWSLTDRRRVRFCAGFLGTTLLLMGASLWIWPHWVAQWTKVLLGYHRYATPPLVTLLPGETLGPYLGPAAMVALLGLGTVLAWKNRRASSDSPRFWLTLSLLLAITSVALLPGQAIYDHVILIPGIIIVLRYRRELRAASRVPRALLILGTIVLFWPWIAAFALLAMHSLLTPERFEYVFALPIRTAASLPFAVLALLACATRVNSPEIQELC